MTNREGEGYKSSIKRTTRLAAIALLPAPTLRRPKLVASQPREQDTSSETLQPIQTGTLLSVNNRMSEIASTVRIPDNPPTTEDPYGILSRSAGTDLIDHDAAEAKESERPLQRFVLLHELAEMLLRVDLGMFRRISFDSDPVFRLSVVLDPESSCTLHSDLRVVRQLSTPIQ